MTNVAKGFRLMGAAALVVSCGTGGEQTTHPGHGPGNVFVKGLVSSCPVIAEVLVSPPRAAVGGTTTVSASASDANDNPLSYRWSASSGVLENARTAVAELIVTLPGTTLLELVVSNGSCSDQWTVRLTVADGADGSAP